MESQMLIQIYANQLRMNDTIYKFCSNWAISSTEKGGMYNQIFRRKKNVWLLSEISAPQKKTAGVRW
jgi:hypothetical protein